MKQVLLSITELKRVTVDAETEEEVRAAIDIGNYTEVRTLDQSVEIENIE